MADPYAALQLWGLLSIAGAFIPIVFTFYLRHLERFNREPIAAVIRSFLFGGIFSVIFALVFDHFLGQGFGTLEREYGFHPLQGQSVTSQVFLAVIIAPLAEELAKAFGVKASLSKFHELEDGIIYGAAAGLGFSATENLLYEWRALHEQATLAVLGLGVMRSFTSTLLHATTSGIVGYGIAKAKHVGLGLLTIAPYYLIAVAIHASYNAAASADQLWIAAALVIIIAQIGFRFTIHRIRRLDSAGRTA